MELGTHKHFSDAILINTYRPGKIFTPGREFIGRINIEIAVNRHPGGSIHQRIQYPVVGSSEILIIPHPRTVAQFTGGKTAVLGTLFAAVTGKRPQTGHQLIIVPGVPRIGILGTGERIGERRIGGIDAAHQMRERIGTVPIVEGAVVEP